MPEQTGQLRFLKQRRQQAEAKEVLRKQEVDQEYELKKEAQKHAQMVKELLQDDRFKLFRQMLEEVAQQEASRLIYFQSANRTDFQNTFEFGVSVGRLRLTEWILSYPENILALSEQGDSPQAGNGATDPVIAS